MEEFEKRGVSLPRKRFCQKRQWFLVFITSFALCFLSIRQAEAIQLSDLQQCPQLTYALAKNCSSDLRIPITTTAQSDCCTLAKQANAARCYCDGEILKAGNKTGLTPNTINSSLVQLCQVPTQDLHIFNISGCDAAPSPDSADAPSPVDMQCQQITDPIFKTCNATTDPGCCSLLSEANAKQCFCEVSILNAGREVSMTPEVIRRALIFCSVAPQDVDVLNVGGCGGTPDPARAPESNVALCQRLTFSLFADCSTETGSIRSFKASSECCGLAGQSNVAYCFCDKLLYAGAVEIGVNPGSFAEQISAGCNVPYESLNVYNLTGCSPAPPVTPLLDVVRCQTKLLDLARDCQSILNTPVSNLTLAAECCRRSKEANEAYCYCDYGLVSSGASIGVTPTLLKNSLHDFCEVPLNMLNIVNVSGCDPLAAPFLPPPPGKLAPPPAPNRGAAPKQGIVNVMVAVAAVILATFLLL